RRRAELLRRRRAGPRRRRLVQLVLVAADLGVLLQEDGGDLALEGGAELLLEGVEAARGALDVALVDEEARPARAGRR
ncbi:hypothetical protein DKP78_26705, partial [Enterococcus faecium]